MSTRLLTYAICLGCAAYLATEALPRAVHPDDADSPSSRRPATTHARAETRGGAVDAAVATALLDRGVATLRAAQWLRLTIWQKQHGAEGFEAESRLLLGPDGCARLDVAVGAGAAPVRRSIISDGRVLAVVRNAERDPEDKKQVLGFCLPQAPEVRSEVLRRHGCSGPQALIELLRSSVGKWQAHEVTRAGQRRVRLTGPITAPERVASMVCDAGWCRLDLDAGTGWLERVEIGRGAAPAAAPGAAPVLEMEFRDAALNQALSEAECAQLFSYRPR